MILGNIFVFFYLVLFYQNNWFSLLLKGPAFRQFVLLRWVIVFKLLFGFYSTWCRLPLFIYAWLPALSFYTFCWAVCEDRPALPKLDSLLLPNSSCSPIVSERIFVWSRRYLVFFFWFFSFIYRLPLNYNFRVTTFPYTVSSRSAVWTFLWL